MKHTTATGIVMERPITVDKFAIECIILLICRTGHFSDKQLLLTVSTSEPTLHTNNKRHAFSLFATANMNAEKLELFFIKRKLKVEMGLLMAVFWTLLAVAVVFNFNAIIYHLGYLQVYIYNHHLSDIIMWTIYIRFIALVFVFSIYFSFREYPG